MNEQIERSFAGILKGHLPSLQVRAATSSEPLPGDVQLAVVTCPEVEHVVGPLYRATIKIWLGTPAFNVAETTHRAAAGHISAALARSAEAILETTAEFNQAAAPLELRGLHLRSITSEVVDDTWRTTFELLLGIAAG